MLKTIEVIIEPNGVIRWKEPFSLNSPKRAILTILDDEVPPQNHSITLMSEKALAQEWLNSDEEEAWKHLQKG